MPEPSSFDYAIIRLVPHEERGELINVGVILYCRAQAYLDVRIAFDPQKLRALDPDADVESVRKQLEAIPQICKGGKNLGALSELSQGERFFWLVSPRNTIVQMSPMHTGICTDPVAELEHLLDTMVK